ncbi:MAG: FtsL-like putative cell division protein [Siphonobacter sp.]
MSKLISWTRSLAQNLDVNQWWGEASQNQKLLNAGLVVLLMITYIAWVLRGESLIRETDRLKREISEQNAELTYEESKLVQESRQSRIILKVAPLGLKDYRNQRPPVKIVVPSTVNE